MELLQQQYSVYIVKCRDSTLYTGISTDVGQRVEKHNKGTGAKYTKVRRPVQLLYCRVIGTKSDALKEEYRIKQLSRKAKLELCQKSYLPMDVSM